MRLERLSVAAIGAVAFACAVIAGCPDKTDTGQATSASVSLAPSSVAGPSTAAPARGGDSHDASTAGPPTAITSSRGGTASAAPISSGTPSGGGCTASGGRVVTAMCCASVGDFPNSCKVGACGCAPTSSHGVKSCECPAGKCFDGSRCVAGP